MDWKRCAGAMSPSFLLGCWWIRVPNLVFHTPTIVGVPSEQRDQFAFDVDLLRATSCRKLEVRHFVRSIPHLGGSYGRDDNIGDSLVQPLLSKRFQLVAAMD